MCCNRHVGRLVSTQCREVEWRLSIEVRRVHLRTTAALHDRIAAFWAPLACCKMKGRSPELLVRHVYAQEVLSVAQGSAQLLEASMCCYMEQRPATRIELIREGPQRKRSKDHCVFQAAVRDSLKASPVAHVLRQRWPGRTFFLVGEAGLQVLRSWIGRSILSLSLLSRHLLLFGRCVWKQFLCYVCSILGRRLRSRFLL
mmetsp:Transcript_37325/g.87573  ORF Transcript_37325/g.87573 Transcript_37325/m.87573 type:complete len:200 (-) Transcript_37325:513-1112(-)